MEGSPFDLEQIFSKTQEVHAAILAKNHGFSNSTSISPLIRNVNPKMGFPLKSRHVRAVIPKRCAGYFYFFEH